jgi:hypothetical protein
VIHKQITDTSRGNKHETHRVLCSAFMRVFLEVRSP